jgi:ornithine lipid ester-linked acyl 2-hydroxylase
MASKSAQNEKLYFSFLHQKDESNPDITYYDSNDFEWTCIIENNWEIIQKEVVDFLNNNEKEVKPYFAREMVNEPNKWKAFSFYFWGLRMSQNAVNSCPKSMELLKNIPNIVSASVSIMEPYSEIKPHFGDTNAVYRCHLGLIVPSDNTEECGFRVGYEDRYWNEGKLMIFNDAAYHKAWNKTAKRRVVLLFDVIKPEYQDSKKWICAKVRGNIFWQIISEKTGILKSKKNAFTKLMSIFLAINVYLFVFSLNRKSALVK